MIRRIAVWIVGLVIALPILAIGGILIALNTAPGRTLVETQTARLTGGMVVLQGLSGSFPLAPRIARVEIHDAAGAWLTVQDIALDWSPIELLHRVAHAQKLSAGVISLPRLPQSSGAASSSGGSGFELPVRVDIDALSIGRAEIGAPVAGVAALLRLAGQVHLVTLQTGRADLTIDQIDGPGRYKFAGELGPVNLAAHLNLDEPTPGLLSGLAQMPDLGAVSVQADLDGPRQASELTLAIKAGALRADAHGLLNLPGQTLDLDVTAAAPQMQPRPGLSWAAIALDAHVHGPFTQPDAAGTLQVDSFAAAGAAIGRLSAKISGNAGKIALDASAAGLRIPGPKPDLLAAEPVLLTAAAQLDAVDRPITFSLHHRLITASGTLTTGGDLGARATLALPDLTPFAAIGGLALQGSTQLDVTATTTKATIDGKLHITGGMAPLPALVGDATLGLTASLPGADAALSRLTLARLTLDGKAIKLAATGGLTGGQVQADGTLDLSNLTVLTPQLAGTLAAKFHAEGPTDNLAAQAELDGDVTVQGHRGPLKATVSAAGLPAKPSGHLLAQGTLDSAPLSVDAEMQRDETGTLKITIAHTDWKSAKLDGTLTLAPGASLPQGRVTLHMSRLADLRPLIGQDLVGGIELNADLSSPERVHVQLNATQAGVPGTAEIGTARLTGDVRDPTTHPVIDATLSLEGLHAGDISGNANLQVRGPQEALALRLDAGLHGVAGADATLSAAATIDAIKRHVALNNLQTDWKGLAARLLAPAHIDLANGVSVDRLRLGLGQAELEVAGRALPTLDLTVAARRVTPDLARVFVPDLQADGNLTADARLTGPPARPTGTVKLTADGLHMRTGPGRTLPVANLVANATLAGTSARLDANLTAGTTHFALTGTAPLAATGALNLHATGAVNLALLDPILAAQGRRMRGNLAIDATVTGPLTAPLLGGSAQLTQGDLQDFSQGVHLTAMQATLQALGQEVRISQFSARAGAGTIGATGTIGVLAPQMPVDITITARNAKPIASDLLTAVLDADLTVRGHVGGQLAAAGTVRIQSANIQIPENLPTSVAVLNVRIQGAKPPPPSPGPDISLNLDLAAAQGVFVRGRGLDAELGGKMHVGGNAASPRTTGGFSLRRGTFALAGVTLNFASGEISFNGASKIDPALNFVANSSNGSVTATLTIGGYASAPKITLSSVPDLPQDEVLAYLLFRTSASNLSAFQLAEIGAALAQISGVTGGMDPLASARKALGLDELNVGTSATGSPTLNAGRYVAKGVFVGAKQGIGGNAGSQATVQIDITKGLKLETDAGSGTGGNSVGLTYQFEY